MANLGYGLLGFAGKPEVAQRNLEMRAAQEQNFVTMQRNNFMKMAEVTRDASPEDQQKFLPVLMERGRMIGMNPQEVQAFIQSPQEPLKEISMLQDGKSMGAIIRPYEGQTWEKPPPASAVSIEDSFNQGGLDKVNARNVQGEMIKATGSIDRLLEIKKQIKDEYLTYWGKAKAAGFQFAEALGAELDPENKQFLEDFSKFKQSALSNLNQYIHEMTGAQLSVFEADRLRKAIPDPGDKVWNGMSPTQFNATLDGTLAELSRVYARNKLLLQEGLDKWDFENNPDLEGPIKLSEVDSKIEARGDAYYNGLINDGKTPEEAEALTRQYIRNTYRIR